MKKQRLPTAIEELNKLFIYDKSMVMDYMFGFEKLDVWRIAKEMGFVSEEKYKTLRLKIQEIRSNIRMFKFGLKS